MRATHPTPHLVFQHTVTHSIDCNICFNLNSFSLSLDSDLKVQAWVVDLSENDDIVDFSPLVFAETETTSVGGRSHPKW